MPQSKLARQAQRGLSYTLPPPSEGKANSSSGGGSIPKRAPATNPRLSRRCSPLSHSNPCVDFEECCVRFWDRITLAFRNSFHSNEIAVSRKQRVFMKSVPFGSLQPKGACHVRPFLLYDGTIIRYSREDHDMGFAGLLQKVHENPFHCGFQAVRREGNLEGTQEALRRCPSMPPWWKEWANPIHGLAR